MFGAESEDSSTITSSTDETTSNLANMSLTRYEEKEMTPYLSSPDQMITFLVLKAAFNGPFIEGKTGVYKLEDVNPETFRLFAEHLYSGKITLLHHNVNPVGNHGKVYNHTNECAEQDLTLAQLWVLADRFLVRTLQNQVVVHMERIRQPCGKTGTACWDYVYGNTSPGSRLRALIAEQCAWSETFDWGDSQQVPQNLLKDIISSSLSKGLAGSISTEEF
ncbi:hypothetical protein IFR05_001483 [Cadophora sp. M221]|nr:hypothetical protein IFR05_001483 [Cadophora sp. M221]